MPRQWHVQSWIRVVVSTFLETLPLVCSYAFIHVEKGMLPRGGSGDCVVLLVYLSLYWKF
jgi:hypothetical protein